MGNINIFVIYIFKFNVLYTVLYNIANLLYFIFGLLDIEILLLNQNSLDNVMVLILLEGNKPFLIIHESSELIFLKLN